MTRSAVWTNATIQTDGAATEQVEEARSQRFSATSGWSPAHDSPGVGLEPAVALDELGDGFALGIADGEIRAARFRPESGWQMPVTLGEAAASSTFLQARPYLVVDRGGRAAALWRTASTLMFSRFDESL